MQLPIIQENAQTMTSQQIANLVSKRHDNVKRTIENLCDKGVIRHPQVEDVRNHQEQLVKNYIFTGGQGRIDSIIVVAQLSPEFTAALVKRWDELEKHIAQPIAPVLPDFTNPADAAIAWAAEYKAKELAQAQVIELQPKAAALDTLSHAKGSLGIRETAKAVGIPEREFVTRCLGENKPKSSRFMYRDNDGKLNAHAHRIKQGFMTQKITSYQGKNGHDLVTIKVKFTAAGLIHIAKRMQNKVVNELKVLEAV